MEEKQEQKEVERQQKVKSILKEIQLGEESKIIKGLKVLKEIGDDQVVLPIIEVWNKGVSPRVEEEIIAFLGDIKSSSSEEIIMTVLLDNVYAKIHQSLLSTIWKSKVDYSEYLVDFVTLAVQYDFMIALECMTIIEHLDGPFEEYQLLEAQVILREYAETQQQKIVDPIEKVKLVSKIGEIIQGFEN